MIPTETDLINLRIDFMGEGRTNKEITQSILDEFRTGLKKQIIADMLDAEEYYMCRNIGIQKKTRSYTVDGMLVENKTLSNAKIPSAFLRLSVQQKVNYGFGKPFVIEVSKKGIEPTAEQDENAKTYITEWQNYFNANRRKIIKTLAKAAINKGISWLYITIIDGELDITVMDSEQIYPQWNDKMHTELDVIVRDYLVIEYIKNERKEIRKVEFWNKEVVERYIDDGELKPDPDYPAPEPHMTNDETGILWERVPFIALKGNEDELPLLNVIRSIIDSYDYLRSKGVDALIDDIDAVLVIKGISPEMGLLQEARQAILNSRIISVDESGSADYVKVNTDITALQAKLEGLQKEIQRYSQSVETQDIRLGNEASGVAIKLRYQELDTYTNGVAVEFEAFIQQLKFFFDIWLEFKGVGTVDKWAEYEIEVTLNRDMMIDTAASIQEAVALMATGVSQETIDNWNPAVPDHTTENARREREQKADENIIFNFPQQQPSE